MGTGAPPGPKGLEGQFNSHAGRIGWKFYYIIARGVEFNIFKYLGNPGIWAGERVPRKPGWMWW